MPLVDKTIVKCSVELVSVFWYSLFIALFSFPAIITGSMS